MKDPKKILKNWLDQHGFDGTFTFEEENEGVEKIYVAKLPLPIETGHGSRTCPSHIFGPSQSKSSVSFKTQRALPRKKGTQRGSVPLTPAGSWMLPASSGGRPLTLPCERR